MIIFDKELKNPVKNITAFNNEEFKKAFEEIETLRKTHILAGYVRYEAKDVFLGRPVISGMPLLYFEVFEVDGFDDGECSGFLLLRSDSSGISQEIAQTPAYRSLPHSHCEAKIPNTCDAKMEKVGGSVCSGFENSLKNQQNPEPAQGESENRAEKQNFQPPQAPQEYIFPAPSITYEEFSGAITKIKDEIAQGNTYEVNYTYDHEAEFFGDSYSLFLSLLREQKTPDRKSTRLNSSH